MNSKKSFESGFTLIELLVVIAIIGILSAVVMAALGSAKAKSNDSAISSIMSSMRAQAALYYSATGNFGTVAAGTSAAQCTAGSGATNMYLSSATPNLANLLADLARKNGATLGTAGAAGTKNIICSTTGSPASAWAVVASTSSSTTVNWCVDSTGASKSVTGTDLINTTTGLCK